MSTIAVIKQSADDWNYAQIVTCEQAEFDAPEFDFDELYVVAEVVSSAHRFYGEDGVEFDEKVWRDDIARALVQVGYAVTGDPTRISDYVQTVPVAEIMSKNSWYVEAERWVEQSCDKCPSSDTQYRAKATAARAAQRLANSHGHDFAVVAWSEAGRSCSIAPLIVCADEEV